jgi:hypothetical protein
MRMFVAISCSLNGRPRFAGDGGDINTVGTYHDAAERAKRVPTRQPLSSAEFPRKSCGTEPLRGHQPDLLRSHLNSLSKARTGASNVRLCGRQFLLSEVTENEIRFARQRRILLMSPC